MEISINRREYDLCFKRHTENKKSRENIKKNYVKFHTRVMHSLDFRKSSKRKVERNFENCDCLFYICYSIYILFLFSFFFFFFLLLQFSRYNVHMYVGVFKGWVGVGGILGPIRIFGLTIYRNRRV